MSKHCPHCNHLQQESTQYCTVCGRSLDVGLESISVSQDVPHLGLRILARLIDYVLICLLVTLVDMETGGIFKRALEWLSYGIRELPQVVFPGVILSFISTVYFVLFQSLTGQTLGKWSCGLVVLNSKQQPSSLWAHLIREFGVHFTFMTGNWLWVVLYFSKKRRGFHDWISKTQVFALETSRPETFKSIAPDF